MAGDGVGEGLVGEDWARRTGDVVGEYLASLGSLPGMMETREPTGVWSKRVMTSRERMRMQPQLTGAPSLDSSVVPWM